MADQIRVLIVDDIPETRDHLTKLLGFESDIEVVGAASSGAQALQLAAELMPDVVLMDINMPDMDGIAATERLSAEVPDAAVVMMSVQGEADYLRRSMLAGAREFLVKPFSSDELTASIRQVYAREQEKQSRRAAAPVMVSSNGTGPAAPTRRRRRSRRPDRRGLPPEGRRRPDDDRGQHGDRGRDRARQVGRARRRLVPVRRRRRPAQPEPEEQVDRGPGPGARGRRAGVARHVRHQPLGRRPGAARAAVARDGRADHADGRQARPRGAPPAARPRHRRLHRRGSTRRRWRSSTRPTPS